MAEAARNTSSALSLVTQEPIVKALKRALEDIAANDGQIEPSLGVALTNNAGEKKALALSPAVRDISGESGRFLEEQGDAYDRLANECKQRGLIKDIPPEPNRAASR